MYNSIQHFNEFGLREIEEVIKTFVAEKKDLADFVLDLQEILYELGRSVNAAALCPAVDVVNCPYIDGIGVHM